MRIARPQRRTRAEMDRELAELRVRLAEAHDLLGAIGRGEIDALVVDAGEGPRVVPLEAGREPYRVLMESLGEGALSLAADGTIRYANQRFAAMAGVPLEQLPGTSLLDLVDPDDGESLRAALTREDAAADGLQLLLRARGGDPVPVHVSLGSPPEGRPDAQRGAIVTDLSAVRRAEETLRAFTHYVVRAQELERERVFGELHDNIAQRLCGILMRWRMLAGKLEVQDEALRAEQQRLIGLLGEAAAEVEHVSERLHAHGLELVGLVPALRAAADEWAERTGTEVGFDDRSGDARAAPGADVALYRILQLALENVELHAKARRVCVRLSHGEEGLVLEVSDDGAGFEERAGQPAAPDRAGVGLVGMRERARSVGGSVRVASDPGCGTSVTARVPLAPADDTAGGR